MRTIVIACILLLQHVASAQYAPQAGISGSTAVSASSADIIGWADYCNVQRGFLDIANPGLGVVTGGESSNATGAADGSIVCLGDSGIAVLTFPGAIYNGPGADFVVFENGFPDPADPSMAFLEFAFVEVSSDGINYFRFPANSNTQTNTQIPGSGIYLNASLVNNLAGKYIAMFGTPFDLDELPADATLDINNITHVRLVDVTGDLGIHASHDVAGRTINDPYPTPFPSGGFDLDAVGAIHMQTTGVSIATSNINASLYPNPATDKLFISCNASSNKPMHATIRSVTGAASTEIELNTNRTEVSLTQFASGIYYLLITDNTGGQWACRFVKY